MKKMKKILKNLLMKKMKILLLAQQDILRLALIALRIKKRIENSSIKARIFYFLRYIMSVGFVASILIQNKV
jgi:hypothetical protein